MTKRRNAPAEPETPEPGILGSLELTPADRLEPHPMNPRRGDVDLIRESIRRNGWHGSIVAQRSSGYILAGNHRFLAGRAEGIERFPVHWVDLDDDAALRVLLADNRTSDVATYDDPTLLQLFAQIGDPVEATRILADPESSEDDRREAIRYLAQTAPTERFAGTGWSRDAVMQVTLGLEGGAAEDNGSRGNKELDRERWATVDVRQIGLVMNETEFARAVRILLYIRSEEGLETNTDAVLYLLDQYNDRLDGLPLQAERGAIS